MTKKNETNASEARGGAPPSRGGEERVTSPGNDPRLAAFIRNAIFGGPFERRERWPFAVVVLRAEEKRVTSRGDHAQWLLAADLKSAARECLSRRVPVGSVLVWLEVEDPVAVSSFITCNLDIGTGGRSKRASVERTPARRLAEMARGLGLPADSNGTQIGGRIAALACSPRKQILENQYAAITAVNSRNHE